MASRKIPNNAWLNATTPEGVDEAPFSSTAEETQTVAEAIAEVLKSSGIQAEVAASVASPQSTRFEIVLAPGVSLSELGELKTRFSERLNRFGAIRMLLPIPGRDCAGIEVPNSHRIFFPAIELFEDQAWEAADGRLEAMVGKDGQRTHSVDISRGNHLLVAGHDGAGKSNLMRQILASLISRNSPDALRLLLFENKGDTFKPFAGIPHLLAPETKDTENGVAMLEWCVQETARRRKLLAQAAARNLGEYNGARPDSQLPEIVFMIDEIAPMMSTRLLERVHGLLCGLDSAGTTVGVHLVVATAILPDQSLLETFDFRVCGKCLQGALSKMLLGEEGAETLLGMGDFLLKTGESPIRLQSALMAPEECRRLAAECTAAYPGRYDQDVQHFIKTSAEASHASALAEKESSEPMLNFTEPTANDALKAVLAADKATPEIVSAALGVSSERAMNLLDELAFHGYLGIQDTTGERQILFNKIPPELRGEGHETRKTIESLMEELAEKIRVAAPNSRTVAEYNKGVHAIGKKIVEEAAEVWMAAEYEGPDNTALEISQLLYHLMVLMLKKKISLEEIYRHL